MLALQKGFYGEFNNSISHLCSQWSLGFGFIKPSLEEQQSLSLLRKLDGSWTSIFLLSNLFGGGTLGSFVSLSEPIVLITDSITDATNGVGQISLTAVYREQWIFWALPIQPSLLYIYIYITLTCIILLFLLYSVP